MREQCKFEAFLMIFFHVMNNLKGINELISRNTKK